MHLIEPSTLYILTAIGSIFTGLILLMDSIIHNKNDKKTNIYIIGKGIQTIAIIFMFISLSVDHEVMVVAGISLFYWGIGGEVFTLISINGPSNLKILVKPISFTIVFILISALFILYDQPIYYRVFLASIFYAHTFLFMGIKLNVDKSSTKIQKLTGGISLVVAATYLLKAIFAIQNQSSAQIFSTEPIHVLALVATMFVIWSYPLLYLLILKEKDEKILLDNQKKIQEQYSEILAQNEEIQATNEELITTQEIQKETENKLRKSNADLEKLNATKDKFFRIIAHDLKSPLSSLVSITDLFINNINKYAPDRIKELLVLLNKNTLNATKLLQNLQIWARSQSGEIQFNPESISITQIIFENISLLKTTAQKKSIELTSGIEKDKKVNVDKNMISTVIRNLISNAIKFTNNHGKITISSIENNHEIIISVSDNGVGISSETRKNLFRIDKNFTTPGTNNEHGTGLGLILCKEFVEKNGGKIWVESKLGEGSTFKFSIPL